MMNTPKTLLRKAQAQRSLLKIDSLLDDSLAKLYAVLRTTDKNSQQTMLLTQVANNLAKIQRLMKQYMKNPP